MVVGVKPFAYSYSNMPFNIGCYWYCQTDRTVRISLIHPSRSRPERSIKTIRKWFDLAGSIDFDVMVSVDEDDPLLWKYKDSYADFDEDSSADVDMICTNNISGINAINNAAKEVKGDILVVVSDDTEPVQDWDVKLLAEVEGKTDWILKTKDGIQDYIITFPILDRTYYNRTGYIYHPEFQHLFCDTYLTCVADITGRKITSNLMFKHDHYSVNGTEPDDLHKRNDATWKQGQETFIRLMKQFSPQERARIKDPGMRSWLRNHGV